MYNIVPFHPFIYEEVGSDQALEHPGQISAVSEVFDKRVAEGVRCVKSPTKRVSKQQNASDLLSMTVSVQASRQT